MSNSQVFFLLPSSDVIIGESGVICNVEGSTMNKILEEKSCPTDNNENNNNNPNNNNSNNNHFFPPISMNTSINNYVDSNSTNQSPATVKYPLIPMEIAREGSHQSTNILITENDDLNNNNNNNSSDTFSPLGINSPTGFSHRKNTGDSLPPLKRDGTLTNRNRVDSAMVKEHLKNS